MQALWSRRRIRVLIISFLIAAFALAVGWAVQGQAKASHYRRLLEQDYQRAFAQLTTAVGELDSALQKIRYTSSSTLFSTLCAQAFSQATAAQTALGQLPMGYVELEQTASFLAKAGDYAMALARQGEEPSDDDWETIAALSDTASGLDTLLRDLEADLMGGSVTLESVEQIQERLSQATGDDQSPATAGSTFQTVESDFPEVPSLIYDGPFSDHLSQRSPKGLEGLAEVSRDEARAAAAQFLGLDPVLFTPVSQGEGVLPTWGFEASVDGGSLYVSVTRQGGKILEVLSSRPVADATLSPEEGVAIAKTFLEQRGYPSMAETYYLIQDNTLTVNFAYQDGDILCYPDLIKVSVALDNGDIVGFASQGYLMNHTSRAYTENITDRAQVESNVGDTLTVLSHRLALIPTEGEYELLCHEFRCETEDGQHILLYFDAATGAQKRILLLLEDESGTLVQ